jgi:hypothetical protein
MNTNANSFFDILKKNSDMGHLKRDRAFLRQVELVCSSPGTSPTHATGKVSEKTGLADAMSLYRFVDNDEAKLVDLRKARAATVLDTISEDSDILLLHDMSHLDYSRHNSKHDRRKIGDHRGMGYEYVCCMAVDPESGASLGVIHDTVINQDGPDDRDMMDYDYDPLLADFSNEEKERLAANHRHQMAVHINGTSSMLKNRHVIDVGDREFDDIFILDCCKQNNRDFVIRSSGNRNIAVPQYDWIPKTVLTEKRYGHSIPDDYVCVNFTKVIEHIPMQSYKTLPLDSYNRVVDKANAKRFAKLSIGSFKVCLYRMAKRNKNYVKTPRLVELNAVVIRELKTPKNRKPLLWILFTSLAADNLEQMSYVGRCYELRWNIESFFRLLKSGYRLTNIRFDNAQKIARYLVVITLAAMTILSLKKQIGLSEGGNLNDEDYQRVKKAILELENTEIDLSLRIFAFIAKNGGWLGRRRDPIGPTILMRGILHLLAVIDANLRFGSLIDETLKNPELLKRLLCV